MPNYEYFCPSNQQSVTAHHCCRHQVATWGQLCELIQMPLGDTAPNVIVTITKQTECHCHDGEDHDCCHGHDEHEHAQGDCCCHGQTVQLSVAGSE